MKIIENSMIVTGDEMRIIENGYILIAEGRIDKVERGKPPNLVGEKINGQGCLVIPGLINAHVHIGDSVGKETGLGKTVSEIVKPQSGLKHEILRRTPIEKIIRAMKDAINEMLNGGTTTFADFREGGANGVKLLEKAIVDSPIRALKLARPDFYFSAKDLEKNKEGVSGRVSKEVKRLMHFSDGIGLSSPNEFTDNSLKQISKIAKGRKRIVATHVAEHSNSLAISMRRSGLSEVKRAVTYLRPDFLVHLTHATDKDIKTVAEEKISAVCCPRANGVLGLGFPPVRKLLESGVNVALGTDNIMINSPNLFREMDYLSKSIRAFERDPSFPSPLEIFKMVTINAAKALRMERTVGSIKRGKLANLVFIDSEAVNIKPIHDPLATLVHRVTQDNVKMVMIDGNVALNKL
ncbi:MAG: amidohydrolase family protein [Candidatus Bathyarchaeota archaeon]